MKRICKLTVLMLVLLALVLQLPSMSLAAGDQIVTTPTGYTSAWQVEYKKVNGTVVNWGARGEVCTFLSTYALDYYAGSYSWDVLSAYDGGTGTSDAYGSALYDALQAMMRSKHTNIQSYQETRPYYKYTDCVSNDYSQVSSFYSGKLVGSNWDGKTYNREHTWPDSKGLGGSDEDDIMMLRPTVPSENSSRGNKAYGEGQGYFDPGESVRGDCARIILYIFTRWGNTKYLWGSAGVMENLDILLKWMEEDPVDTWEMGRNDAVQSITGARNAFVDYPELAWMLFGREVPEQMVTPSGNGATACRHSHTTLRDQKAATCGAYGYTGDTYCDDCGKKIKDGSKIPATGDHSYGDWMVTREATMEKPGEKERRCTACGDMETAQIPKLNAPPCNHAETELRGAEENSCDRDGYSGDQYCIDCGLLLRSGSKIPATGEHVYGVWILIREATGTQTGVRRRECETCGATEIEELPLCAHENRQLRDEKTATCGASGYSGDLYCLDCGDLVQEGAVTRATGLHSYSDWIDTENGRSRSCEVCDHRQTVQSGATEQEGNIRWIVIGLVGAAATMMAVAVIILPRKRQ